jgi:hypothetical protein
LIIHAPSYVEVGTEKKGVDVVVDGGGGNAAGFDLSYVPATNVFVPLA